MPQQQKNLLEIITAGLRTNVKQYAMFIALMSIWIIFQILALVFKPESGGFITPRNITTLFLQNHYIIVLAMGMVLVMVAGHIDLSVGWLGGAAGALAAALHQSLGLPIWAMFIIPLVFGLVIGVWQGFWIAYQGIPAFIVTLSSFLLLKGLLILITGSQTITTPEEFNVLGNGFLPQMFLHGQVGTDVPFHDTSLFIMVIFVGLYIVWEFKNRQNRQQYGFEVLPIVLQILKIVFVSSIIIAGFSMMIFYEGIPCSVLLLLILALVFVFITNKTVFGRHVYAIGGNKEAARFSGINIRLGTMGIFIIMGILAGLAGILFTGRLASASPTAGTLWELDAIAAAVVGGTSTMGGVGTIIGAMTGAIVMGSLNNGFYLLSVPLAFQYIIKGLILVLAVWFDLSSKRRR